MSWRRAPHLRRRRLRGANDNFVAARGARHEPPDQEPPFDAPEEDYAFGELCAADDATECDAGDAGVADILPPFDESEDTAQAPVATQAPPPPIFDDETPPFDPPDDETFGEFEARAPSPALVAVMAAAEELLLQKSQEPASPPAPAPVAQPRRASHWSELPAPTIAIHASWDRPEAAHAFSAFAADARLARAHVAVQRGGIDGAIVHFAANTAPDLLILETTLNARQMLEGLDRLLPLLGRETKIVIVGAVNDVTLLRELAARGVCQYVVAPAKPDYLARLVCRLYADSHRSHVLAVIGARGGVGASTIAQSLAWSIAEREQIATTLVDLDLPFGTAALNFRAATPCALDALLDDEAALAAEAAFVRRGARLNILAAHGTLDRPFEPDAETMETLVNRVRRASPFVVLDLPHQWCGWTRQALATADDVLIVAAPDLASLRNAKALLDALKPARGEAAEPMLALSMIGAPKQPEISLKEFSEAVGVAPVVSFAFDPAAFGAGAISGQALSEAAPDSKAARDIDALAGKLAARCPAASRRGATPALSPVLAATAPPAGATPSTTLDVPSALALLERSFSPPAAGEDTQLELPLAAAREASGAAPLDLSEPAFEAGYLEKARAAAEAELRALRSVARKRSFRLGRIAALSFCLALLCGVAAWSQLNGVDAVSEARAEAPGPEAAALPEEEYAAAMALVRASRPREAARILTDLARDDFAPAQRALAKLYERGQGVAQDFAAARVWTERAAAAGNVAAMHDLGVYLAQGEGGLEVDEAGAFRWFRQAAEFGVADSQYNLGVLYLEGRGVAANAGEALFWFLVAAAQGDEGAAARAAELEPRVTPMQAEQARGRALAFAPRAPSAPANL